MFDYFLGGKNNTGVSRLSFFSVINMNIRVIFVSLSAVTNDVYVSVCASCPRRKVPDSRVNYMFPCYVALTLTFF